MSKTSLEYFLYLISKAADPDAVANAVKDRHGDLRRFPEVKKALVEFQRALQMRKAASDVFDKGAEWPEQDPEVYESGEGDAPEDESGVGGE